MSTEQEPVTHGIEDLEVCGRNGCEGRLCFTKPENCSCHISPPCHSCMSVHLHCPECDWEQEDEPEKPMSQSEKEMWAAYAQKQQRIWDAPLDNTRVSYRSNAHSSCSMVKEGVYPQSGNDAADRAMVRKEVDGTFGGRFESFGDGKFKFIAYTD